MFSPDGLALAYFSIEERALKRIAVTGGAPVTVTPLDSPNAPFGGTWSGEHIFFGQIASDSARQRLIRGEAHMGMLDGLLGGIVGAGMVSVVNSIIDQHGGLQGVVSEFEKNGLGATVRSWVGTGPNQAISPDEVHKALGPDLLRQLSEKSGLSVQDLTQKLSQVLPQAVDKMTPNGTIPKA